MTSSDSNHDIPLMRIPPVYPGESCHDLQVLQCQQIRNKRQMIRHRLDFHALVVVTRGAGTYQCDSGPVSKLLAGDMIYLRPGPVFTFGPGDTGDWDEFHCCVAGERLHTWQERGWLPDGDHIWRLPNAEALSTHFRRIAHFHHAHEYGDRDRAIIAAEQLFAEAFHLRQPPNHHHDRLISSCVAYVHQHLAEDIDFIFLARQMGVSYSLLRQRIKQVTGLSPAKLLLQMRCTFAQELLQDADISIQHIAEQCGFDDPYSFSRSFKRSVGIAPSHWRNNIVQWRGR